MKNLARLGYLVRGLIYGTIGVLALQMALSRGSKPANQQGAIATLAQTSIGGVLLYVILVGLIGYALWGVIRAVYDPWHKGTDVKGIVYRIGYLVSAASYSVLALSTYGLITNQGTSSSGSQSTQQQTATIMSKSWGPWAIGIAGVGIFGAGVAQIVVSLRSHFERHFEPRNLSRDQLVWADRIGRVGTAARGVVFVMIGIFLFLAAYNHDPSQAKGIDAVFTDLLYRPYGPWLVGIVGLGLVMFGIYSALCGIWPRFEGQ